MPGYDPQGPVDEPAPRTGDAPCEAAAGGAPGQAAAEPRPTQPAPDPQAAPGPIARQARRGIAARSLRLGALLAVLAAAYAGALVLTHEVSRETAFQRAGASRLELRPDRRDRPYDAAFERSLWVPLDRIPPVLVAAVLAREDRRFRLHPGVDPVGIGRALASLGRAGGGSTITQQLARLLFVGAARSPRRKIDEALVALWLEAILTKDEILELYLNAAPLGAGVRGVEAAARIHVGLSFLRDRAEAARFDALTAAQFAVALSSPGRFDLRDPRQAGRVAAVLARMRADGVPLGKAPLDEAAVRRAIAARPRAAPLALPSAADHRDRALAEAARRAPSKRATYQTAPYLRLDHQLYLDREIARLREDAGLRRDYPHALGYVIDLATGGVTAQTGHAARVYPGSLTKPAILLCAHRRGLGPRTRVLDAPYGDPPQIGNRGRGYAGEIPLRRALALSVNAPFARLLDELGEDCVAHAAAEIGAPMWLSGGGASGRLGRRTMALGAAPVDTGAMLDFYLAVAGCGARARHSHVAALWRPGLWAAGWRDRPAAAAPAPEARAALAEAQAAMAAAAQDGTAHRLGALFRGPVAAKTGTDDEGRQFGLVAFTGRWLVYLSFWTDRPDLVRRALPGAALAPAMAQLLVNLHIGLDRPPLSCDAPPAPQRVAARAPA